MIDLKQIELEIDQLLERETDESLVRWFDEYDNQTYLRKRFGDGAIEPITCPRICKIIRITATRGVSFEQGSNSNTSFCTQGDYGQAA